MNTPSSPSNTLTGRRIDEQKIEDAARRAEARELKAAESREARKAKALTASLRRSSPEWGRASDAPVPALSPVVIEKNSDGIQRAHFLSRGGVALGVVSTAKWRNDVTARRANGETKKIEIGRNANSPRKSQAFKTLEKWLADETASLSPAPAPAAVLPETADDITARVEGRFVAEHFDGEHADAASQYCPECRATETVGRYCRDAAALREVLSALDITDAARAGLDPVGPSGVGPRFVADLAAALARSSAAMVSLSRARAEEAAAAARARTADGGGGGDSGKLSR